MGSPPAPDAFAARPASRDAAVVVAVAPRTHNAVTMSLDAGQQLDLSPAARDHFMTTERPQKVTVAAPRSAPDAVVTTAVSGGAVAAAATAPRAQVAIATSPDAGQQLVLSPAAGDHVATVARLQKIDMTTLHSLDAIAMSIASEGYRRLQSPQRSQPRGGRA